jgi:putative membrane protein
MLIIFFSLWIISCLNPPYPTEMFLQHSVTLAMSVILLTVTARNSLSDKSFAFIVVFMTLHVIGARWIYSYVPYDEWFRALTGTTISALINSGRNHYDRFVHLMFGLLMFLPIREIYEKWFGCSRKFSPILTFLTISGCSLIYEVFEWGLTLVLSPEDADNYNGQQGDLWDAQKDMALALTGSALNLLFYMVKRKITGVQTDAKDDT